MMRRRKLVWWFGHAATPLIALIASGLWIILDNWTVAFSFAVFAVAGALAIPTSWWSYMHGYHRARADLLEAFSRSESVEEFARLASGDPPKPWE
jgi:hypothetical protein